MQSGIYLGPEGAEMAIGPRPGRPPRTTAGRATGSAPKPKKNHPQTRNRRPDPETKAEVEG
jgi:hypothetical protein